MDLGDLFLVHWVFGDSGSEYPDSLSEEMTEGAGMAIALWVGVMAVVVAVLGTVFLLRSYTASSPRSVLTALAAVSALAVGARRVTDEPSRLSVDEWGAMAAIGVGSGLVPLVFWGSVFVVSQYVPEQGLVAIVHALLVVALFCCTVAAVGFATTIAVLVSDSTPRALFVGLPALWGGLTWGWFLAFGHPDLLPFDNPVPGLGPMEIPLLLPSAALAVGGTVGAVLQGAVGGDVEDDAETADATADGGAGAGS